MIVVGIDDTDTIETRGTNYLAREIVRRAADRWRCHRILRHQLLFDSRIPYTSHNGSASMMFEPIGNAEPSQLLELCRHTMQEWYVVGSDPGLCMAEMIPDSVRDFGRRCQQEIVNQEQPRQLAAHHGIHLEGLGGTEGGVIGALAAVGLAITGDDGRIIQWKSWPDDLSGVQSIAAIHQREIVVRDYDTGADIPTGLIDVGKHLRPNFCLQQAVVFARRSFTESGTSTFTALKLP